MAEESLPFTLLVPVMMAAASTLSLAAATVLLGAGIGTLGSTINPFATVIAANAAGISFTDGIWLRVAMLVAGWLICVAYVMRYAKMVRSDPSKSLVADRWEETVPTSSAAKATRCWSSPPPARSCWVSSSPPLP